MKPPRKKHFNQSGLTLLELILVCGLGAFFMTTASRLLVKSLDSASHGETTGVAETEMNLFVLNIRNMFFQRLTLSTIQAKGYEMLSVQPDDNSAPSIFNGIAQNSPAAVTCTSTTDVFPESSVPCQNLSISQLLQDNTTVVRYEFFAACVDGSQNVDYTKAPNMNPAFNCSANPNAPCCAQNKRPVIQVAKWPDFVNQPLVYSIVNQYPHGTAGYAAVFCAKKVWNCLSNQPEILVETGMIYNSAASPTAGFKLIKRQVGLSPIDHTTSLNYLLPN